MFRFDREKKNIVLYLAGKAASQAGSTIYTFAVGWYVLTLTGSAASFGATLALGILPMVLVMPLAGVAADRFNKKRMVVGMDVLNGLLFLTMYGFSVTKGLPLAAIYLTTVLTTILTTFFSISLESSKPELVSKERLMRLNASSRILDSAISIGGPVLGGLAYGIVGIELFLLLNGLSFLLSAFSESKMSFDHQDKVEGGAIESGGIWSRLTADLVEGAQGLKSSPDLMGIAKNLMALNFFVGFSISVPIPYVLSQVIEGGERLLGVVQAAVPVGVILGAFLITRLKWDQPQAMPLALKWANGLLGLSMLGLAGMLVFRAVLPEFVFQGGMIMCMGLVGVGVAWVDLPLGYHFLVSVPEHLRGRILSVTLSLAKLAVPVALMLSSSVADLVPIFCLPLAGGMYYLIFLMATRQKADLVPIFKK